MLKNKKQLVITIVAVIFGSAALVGAYTLGASQQKASQTSQITTIKDNKSTDTAKDVKKTTKDAESIEEAPAEETPSTTPAQTKPTPKPSNPAPQPDKKPMQGIVVSNLQYSVQTDSIVFTFTTPGVFSGDCKVFLQKHGDKAGAWHRATPSGANCTVSIARSQLSSGTWDYEAAFLGDAVYSHQNPKGNLQI